MKRKWFELLDEDGNALTTATAVSVEVENVDMLRDAVFAKVSRALPANVIAPDLTVFANREAFGAKQKLPKPSSSVAEFGYDEDNALIVQAPQRIDIQPHYFITREVCEQVRKAAFQIIDPAKANTGIGMGVFFGPTRAVTCDHNLTDCPTVGSLISIRTKVEIASVQVVARDPDLGFAILKSFQPKSLIPPWNGSPDDLEARDDLVLASFRLGIYEYQEGFKNKLGYTKALCMTVSTFKRHLIYSCPNFAGDSGAAVVMKDGFLVGIHLETINALHEQIERKKDHQGSFD